MVQNFSHWVEYIGQDFFLNFCDFFNLSIALNKLLWFQRLNSLGLPQHEVWPLTHPFLRSFWKSKKQEIYSTTIEIEFTIHNSGPSEQGGRSYPPHYYSPLGLSDLPSAMQEGRDLVRNTPYVVMKRKYNLRSTH